jgi:hypothetical protein
MSDPKTEPMTDVVRTEPANGEPGAPQPVKPSVKRALTGDEVRADEAEHPVGEQQARENRDNEPPA